MENVLSLFCDTSVERYASIQLSKDQLGQPIIFATDGHCLAYYHASSDAYKKSKLEVYRVIRNPNISKVINLSGLDLGKYKVRVEEEIVCVECNGEGIVEYEYSSKSNPRLYEIEHDCPVCKGECFIGSGNYVVELDSDAGVKIFNQYIHLRFIDKIKSASTILNKQIQLIYYNSEDNCVQFKVGDLTVVTMSQKAAFKRIIDLEIE